MKPKAPKSWSLTGLACEFDIPFKTAMSYRNQYTRIEPDVKVPGVSKLQFSPKQAAKFLAARNLFKARLHGKVVQTFFREVMDEFDGDGDLFNEAIGSRPGHKEQLLRTTWLVAYQVENPEAAYIVADSALGADEFRSKVDMVAAAAPVWRCSLITLGGIKD
jgi:hypothetical protein